MTLFSQSGGERNVSESESQLVQRAANGDLKSSDRLAKRYQSAVYGLAYHWTCNFADAEDIVQEALVQGFERLAQLRDPGRFPGWLRMIALNICRKRHRGEQYREVSMDAPAHAEIRDRLADPRPLPDQTIEARQAIEILDVLSEPVRLTVTLFYIDELTHNEISQFLDVPVSTVKSRRAGLALPAGPPRALGLRYPGGAGINGCGDRRQSAQDRGPGD